MTASLDSKEPMHTIVDVNRCNAIADDFISQSELVPSDEDVFEFLESNKKNYAGVFFVLSKNYKVLFAEQYRRSFLHCNLDEFTVEELYYITEGIKRQVVENKNDFFVVMHLFFKQDRLFFQNGNGSDQSSCLVPSCLEDLFLFLLQRFDYKMREFVISGHLRLQNAPKIHDMTLTQLKILKALIETESPILLSYLESLDLKLCICEPVGARRFFLNWYKRLHGGKAIQIQFVSQKR